MVQPYVSKAQEAGLLTGSQVDVGDVESEITRYDMAVILRAAAKKLGAVEKAAQQSQVTDYLDIPTRYADAVLAVYGMGLIQGDQNGNFNGQNTMSRQEVATVMDRLTTLQKKTSEGGNTGTTPETPDADYKLEFYSTVLESGSIVLGERMSAHCRTVTETGESYTAPYGINCSGFTYTSSDPSVLEIKYEGNLSGLYDEWSLTALSLGTATLTFTDPYGVSASFDVSVVSARENIDTRTYTFIISTACFEEHSLRGGAYTTNHFAYEVPYKLYHTRDGGKTSRLVYEGVSPAKGGPYNDQIELELPEDLFYSADAGFYISAEAEIDGQRMVTSDLRTDGRAYPTLVHGIDKFTMEIPLTPPTGEKAKLTFQGAVGHLRASTGLEGFTVRLYHKDGFLVGETVSGANGKFSMDCEVDEIDGGFDLDAAQYYYTAFGEENGVPLELTGIKADGTLRLRSATELGANPQDPRGYPVLV